MIVKVRDKNIISNLNSIANKMLVKKAVFLLALLCVNISFGHTTQRPSRSAGGVEEESNPLLDMASMFIQEALNNQNNNGARGGGGGGGNGAGAGLAGIASLVGSFMQAGGAGQGKSAGGSGAMQILSGIGSLLASAGNNNGARGGGGGGFDPSIIGNVIEMFTQTDDSEDDSTDNHHHKRESDSGIDIGSILQIASAFMSQNNEQPSHHQQKRDVNTNSATPQPQEDNGFMSLLPLVMQAVSSFAGPEGQHTQEKHKNHAWVLPPFLEHLHVLWDHFSNSELADALYEKSGVNTILKVRIFLNLKYSYFCNKFLNIFSVLIFSGFQGSRWSC